jgi:cytidylate kinase
VTVRVLAIDGPAGAGKSTVSRRAADELGLAVLDTGAMYRAVTLACLRAGVSLDDGDACAAVAGRIVIELDDGVTRLDGDDVSSAIRGPDVTAAVSAVSAHPTVRVGLVAHQRRWAEQHGAGVVEGRDIGSVVFPDARCKIFLVASPRERAERRVLDERAAGRTVDVDALVADIERRDRLDSQRAASPLVRAADAVEVDTTGRTIDDVVAEIVARYRAVNDVDEVGG